ncbi:MAG: apolipoprotein N-acyltransferase [Rhodobacterales bacterium]|nr:MAG: apolipoprotein N-acyltransferase [Rhodobacterales bacterium]
MAEQGRSLVTWFEAGASRLCLRRQMALAAGSGALTALGHAPFNLWPLALVGLAECYALFRIASTLRRTALLGWSAGAGYFAISLFWIVEPFFVDATTHGWMAPFALIFLSGGLALFWAGGFGAARALGGGPLAFIAAMAGVELLRSYILTGFPWALVGYVLAPSPAARFAALIGPHGLSIIALAIGITLWRLAGPAWRKSAPLALGYALTFLLAALSWPAVPADPAAPVVRLIQPNAPQHEKWDPQHIPAFFERQLAFTRAQSDTPPDLIVWPETAIPWLLEDAVTPLAMIAEAAAGTPVVLGLRRTEGLPFYNSLIVLDAEGTQTALYDKHHLVPFGEYMPLGNLLAHWGIHGLAAEEGQGYSAGPGPRLIDLPGLGSALPLICYEAVFPQDVNAAPARPRVLLQITNDAWFGQFSGPYQHLQQARMRAIEQGLPMIRVANTGISAMIGPRGHITAQLPLGEAGFTEAPLPPALSPTPYSFTGDLIALFVILLSVTVAYATRGPIDH